MANEWVERVLMARERVESARTRYWELQQSGRNTERVRQKLQSALMQYYDLLHEFKSNNKIKHEWQESGVDNLKKLSNETVETTEDRGGVGRGQRAVKKPKINTVPLTRLVELSYKLDEFANELGFTAAVEEDLPEYELR